MIQVGARAFAAAACAVASSFAAAVALADEPAARPVLSLAAGVARIRIEVSRSNLVVVHDVNVARGAWRGDDLDVFVAFGAPGAPRAFEAWLVPIAPGALEAAAGDKGAPLGWSYAKRRPASAVPLLGRPTMAGVVIQLAGAALGRALAPSAMATLRLRSREPLPPPSVDDGAREIVVRLGDRAAGEPVRTPLTPLVLGRIEVATAEADWIERVEARLCRGAEVGERVRVRLVRPGTSPAAHADDEAVAAVLANRKAGEDLCVRVFTRPGQKSGSAVAAPES